MPGTADEKNAVTDEVLRFLSGYFRGSDVAPDDDIFAMGLVNSLFALELVLFVEKAFGVEVDDDDLELDNFRSAVAMAELVARKKTRASR